MEIAKKIKGVSYDGQNQKYRAYITFKKTRISLGYHKDIRDAIRVRKEAEGILKEIMSEDATILIKLWRRLKTSERKEVLSKQQTTIQPLDYYLLTQAITTYHHPTEKTGLKLVAGGKNLNFACFVFSFLDLNYDTLLKNYDNMLKDYKLINESICSGKFIEFFNDIFYNQISKNTLMFISGYAVSYITKINTVSKSVIYRKIDEDFDIISRQFYGGFFELFRWAEELN